MNGDVIAVNQSIITGFGQYQNLGFGIPARDVKNVIPKILSQPGPNLERLKGLRLPPHDFFRPFQEPFNNNPDLHKF